MKKLFGTILACGLIASGAYQAVAAPVMRLSADGGLTWTNVVDNGPIDSNPLPGFVSYAGPVGNWVAVVSTAIGVPAAGNSITPKMDVSSFSISTEPATLIVQMSDTNFTPFPNETFVASLTTTTEGTVTYNTYRDSGNVLFGTTANSGTASALLVEGPFTGGTFLASNSVVIPNGGASPYSLTLETIVVHTGEAQTSTDALLYALPPPPCDCQLTFDSPTSITNCVGDTIPPVVASQNCGNGSVSVPVTFAGAVTNGICPQIITRTNTATDNCGTVHTFVQTITVNCKPDCTLKASVTTAVAGQGGYSATVADLGPGANYFWTIDNGSITNGQGTTNITWVAGTDLTKPTTICVSVSGAAGCITRCCVEIPLTPPCNCVLTFNAPSKITNCAGDAIAAITASENCGNGAVSVPVTFVGAVTNGVCPQIITRTNSATDDCGTVHIFVQTITVNCLPNCTITPSVTNATVGGSNYTATVANAGAGATYVWTVLNGTINSGQGTTKITWTAGTDTNSPVTIGVTVTTAGGCTSTCSASVTLTPKPPQISLGKGDTATIGFWQNKNGQGLILNASNSPALGNWLGTNYPCMFGNLTGQANSVVAAQFITFFGVKGKKTQAQVMAGALAAYFTSSNLGGGAGPSKFGFNISPGGTGSKTFNVGNLGTVLGLQNNTSYTVFEILQAANSKCPFSQDVYDALNTIFDGINQTGDIK